MAKLSDLGFDRFFEDQLQDEQAIPARIVAEHRGSYEVWSAQGEGAVRLSGRLTRDLEGEAFPGVGDWVTLKSPPGPDGVTIIESLLARRTVFIRGAAGQQARGQVVAANVDVVFIVCGLDNDYNVRRIERYLARTWASGARPVVVLNKADLCENTEERTTEVELAATGASVLVASALLANGLDRVREHLGQGVTAAFIGSSGAGKSTLINALLGEQRMATRETRSRDGRGCHTTTHRQLIWFPEGGLLIDTPGMRELQLLDEEGISTVFSDIQDLSTECRFRDCTHTAEPGCAVREAVDEGDMSDDRLEHYQKLGAEARAYEVRHDERRKRQEDKAFGKMVSRDGALLRRWKQGK
jgi:ribosome biogenesis GTPase